MKGLATLIKWMCVLGCLVAMGCEPAETEDVSVESPVVTELRETPTPPADPAAPAESKPIPLTLQLYDREIHLTLVSGDLEIDALPADGSPIVLPAAPFALRLEGDLEDVSIFAVWDDALLADLRQAHEPFVILSGMGMALEAGYLVALAPEDFELLMSEEEHDAHATELTARLGMEPTILTIPRSYIGYHLRRTGETDFPVETFFDKATRTHIPIDTAKPVTLVMWLDWDQIPDTMFTEIIWMEIPIEFGD
jgi:hypothetical protein